MKNKYGREYQGIRKRYLRKFPNCEMCQAHFKIVPATEVHHIVPISRGGTHEWFNLMSLCRDCHRRMHEKDSN